MVIVLPDIDYGRCEGCGICAESCPGNAVEVIDGRAVIVRPDDCTYCAECEGLCPQGAISCPFEVVYEGRL
ncbi:MAG: ATP-binding protein [Chloroflexota bacterium]